MELWRSVLGACVAHSWGNCGVFKEPYVEPFVKPWWTFRRAFVEPFVKPFVNLSLGTLGASVETIVELLRCR